MANAQVIHQGYSGTLIQVDLGAVGKTPIIAYVKPTSTVVKSLNPIEFYELSGSAAPGKYAFRPSLDMVDEHGTLTVFASGAATTQSTYFIDIVGAEVDENVPPMNEFVTGTQKLGYFVGGALTSGTALRI